MRPLILMYHRIAHTEYDPWNLAVQPGHFSEQLSVLRRSRVPMPLDAFVAGLKSGTVKDNAVAVTFDDGYVDNLYAAKPRLEAADIPATVFLPTGYLNDIQHFWWDEIVALMLGGIAGETLEAGPISDRTMPIGARDLPAVSAAWKSANGPQSLRQKALIDVWGNCRSMPQSQCRKALAWLRSRAEPGFASRLGRPMSHSEVLRLLSDGLINIGAHTVTHPQMPLLDAKSLTGEIEESREVCASIAGRAASAFAYPYGEANSTVRKAIAVGGFEYALGIEPRPVGDAEDFYSLPRIGVPDLDGDAFEIYLRQIETRPIDRPA